MSALITLYTVYADGLSRCAEGVCYEALSVFVMRVGLVLLF